MTAIALRKKLHSMIDSMGEKNLKIVYSIFENEKESGHGEAFYEMLDERYENYRKNGGISRKESKKRVSNLLRSLK